MIEILMPRLSDTMTEGAISSWLKKPGDPVVPGDVLVEIETDKAVMEHEAYEAGTLAEILVAAGENASIGTPIARLDNGRDDIPAPPAEKPTEKPAERRAATPLVRKLAREQGIDLAGVTGTGPGGRIVRADLARTPTAATIPSVTLDTADGRRPVSVPFDSGRRSIAARLTESATTVPTFTVTASAEVDGLLALRSRLNTAIDGTGQKISVNDLIVRAVALALREHPGINASYGPEDGGRTLRHGRINVGVAVAAPTGLVVPVIHDADQMSLSAIGARTRTLGARAADRKLDPADLADGTFTVSNLGMYGAEHFTAIVNPPQGGILAVGAVRPEVVLTDDGVAGRRRMRYTLTADHRIIDGALAAQFLATLTAALENPYRVLA